MKKKLSILIAVVMAISLCLIPSAALADDSVGLDVGVYTNTLVLENKVLGEWQPLTDNIGGILGYNAAGSEFVWGLEATVLMSNVDYALIYYADKPDRFADWGGDNPGALIGYVTSDAYGVIAESGSVELNMDLPCPPDANQFEIAYNVGPDNYAHAHGAKIWLVPASYLPTEWPNDGGWMTWSAVIVDNILFETDLIWYNDVDVESTIISISVNPTTIDFGILTPGMIGGASIAITSGDVPIDVTVSNTLSGVFTNLELDAAVYHTYGASLSANSSIPVAVTLPVPGDYKPAGVETGTLTFIATATPATP